MFPLIRPTDHLQIIQKLNQYYSPYDKNGNLVKVMGLYPFNTGGPDRNVYNPLYNATLNVKSESGYSQWINNFYIDWRISSTIRATGSISYSRSENGSDNFLPPSQYKFHQLRCQWNV